MFLFIIEEQDVLAEKGHILLTMMIPAEQHLGTFVLSPSVQVLAISSNMIRRIQLFWEMPRGVCLRCVSLLFAENPLGTLQKSYGTYEIEIRNLRH